jgi:hypothetical protein
MVAFHIGAVAAFSFGVETLQWEFSCGGLQEALGGMGCQAARTHRGYKTPKWVEYF